MLGSLVKSADILEEHTCCYIPPKCQLTFTEPHGIISQKTEPLIAAPVRTSNPTHENCSFSVKT
jgi:hypothetical protein